MFYFVATVTEKGLNVLIGGRGTLWIYGSLPINPCSHAHARSQPRECARTMTDNVCCDNKEWNDVETFTSSRLTVCDIDDINKTNAPEINNHNDVNSWSTFRNSWIRLQKHLQAT